MSLPQGKPDPIAPVLNALVLASHYLWEKPKGGVHLTPLDLLVLLSSPRWILQSTDMPRFLQINARALSLSGMSFYLPFIA